MLKTKGSRLSKTIIIAVALLTGLAGCLQSETGDTDKEAAVIAESLTIKNNSNDSIQLDLTEDGVLLFISLKDKATLGGNNRAGDLLRKYLKNKQCNIAEFYKEFTGENDVPDNIKEFEKSVNELVAANETEDDAPVDQITRIANADDQNIYKGVYDPGGYLTAAQWREWFSGYKYVDPNRTGYYKLEAWTDFLYVATQPYRGDVQLRTRYKMPFNDWKKFIYYDVDQRYLADIGMVCNGNIWMKAEVTESDGDGFHAAVDVD